MRFHHLCLGVDDIEAAAAALSQTLGAGPFFMVDHPTFDESEYRAGSFTWDHTIAFGYVGSLLVELLQNHRVEPADLGVILGGRPVAHVGYVADDLSSDSDQLHRDGAERILAARSGPVELVFHRAPVVGTVELIQATDFYAEFTAAIAEQSASGAGGPLVRPASSLGLASYGD